MSTPQEIVASWDVIEGKSSTSYGQPKPTGYIIVDGERMAYWLPPGVSLFKPPAHRRKRK